MAVFILSLCVIGLSALGLAVGSILGRGPVQGSCGGLSCNKSLGTSSGKYWACIGCTRHADGETR